MRKLILCLAVALSTVTFVTKAQTLDLGGGLMIPMKEGVNPGIDLRGTYQFNDNWRASLAIDYLFPKTFEAQTGGFGVTTSTETKQSVFIISPEANYLFTELDTEPIKIYAVGGLNFINLFYKTKTEITESGNTTTNDNKDSDLTIGITLGGGAEYDMGNGLKPFAELKYLFNDFGIFTFTVGVKFNLQ